MLERPIIPISYLSAPIACEDIITQVVVVHSCVRNKKISLKSNVRSRSAELADCVDGGTSGSPSYRKDWHNVWRNVLFEVIDRAAGFTSNTVRTPEFAENE